MSDETWFGVRCIFGDSDTELGAARFYEERVTVWQAASADVAVARATAEAQRYATFVGATYLGLAQAYELADELADGAEVFSALRSSTLDAGSYLGTFYAAGQPTEPT